MCTKNEQRKSNHFISKNGGVRVKNISAYWLPDFTLQKVIGGTVYSVSGSYEGIETLDRKLSRILSQKTGDKHDI